MLGVDKGKPIKRINTARNSVVMRAIPKEREQFQVTNHGVLFDTSNPDLDGNRWSEYTQLWHELKYKITKDILQCK